MNATGAAAETRLEKAVRAWNVEAERITETPTSIVALGRRGKLPVVIKIIKFRGDEWSSGQVLEWFDGKGAVRVYDHIDGAMLLECADPGTSLASALPSGGDRWAAEVLGDVVATMAPRTPARGAPTVQEWGEGFERYLSSGDRRLSRGVVSEARRVYSRLCTSQTRPRLLHSDLHHGNALFDSGRGWLAVDPKGVIGEPEYEVGATLRNPLELPDLFTDPAVIRSRVEVLARVACLDRSRILAWAFAQTVLSTIWLVEDGIVVEPNHPWIVLAEVIRPMLEPIDRVVV
jgi:streptomycin 6-kinase